MSELWGGVPALPTDVRESLHGQLERAYPDEGCGWLLRAKDGSLMLQPMRNTLAGVGGRGRNAYAFDPREQLGCERQAALRGDAPLAIYHSHCDAPAFFSAADRAAAAPGGEPLHPGVLYLVVSVVSGRVAEERWFAWAGQGFSEMPCRQM